MRRTHATLTVTALLLAAIVLLSGCGVFVEKNQYLTIEEGAFPKLDHVVTADPGADPSAHSEGDQAAAAGLVSQNGNWTSTTDAETSVEQALRAALDVAATGQGSAEASGADAGGDEGGQQ